MSTTEAPLAYARANAGRFVEELRALVRIPSVASDRRHRQDVARAALWIADHLGGLGLTDVRLLSTAGPPVVFAATQQTAGRPVVLLYGHYDVQPPGPLAAWHTAPFEPAVRGPWLYGRGAADNKGQLFSHLKALECWLHAGGPPVNVKILVEGEEEIGSPHFEAALHAHGRLLQADVAIVSDSPMLAPDRPVVTYALRGSVGLEVRVRGADHDLHSGIFGGAVPDAVQALCRIVAALQDGSGRIAVPGLYDTVREEDEETRRRLRAEGPSDREMLRDALSPPGWGEREYSLFERTTIRPALTVTTFRGGHVDPGDRAAVPAGAFARITVRLVAAQQPDRILRLLARRIVQVAPAGVRVTLRARRGSRPYRIAADHAAVQAAIRACARAFGRRPALLPSGGSVAAVPLLAEVLGVPSVLVGFGLPDDGKHGPNERFSLPTFRRAIATSILFLEEVASGLPGRTGVGERRAA